jgi:hypothetical protein
MGCDSAQETTEWPALPIGIQPGTRLRPKQLLADDGTIMVHPTTWIDSEFGECSFRFASDGKWRCLPNADSQSVGFLDPSCVQKVYVHNLQEPCAPVGTLVVSTTPKANRCDHDMSRVMNVVKKIDAKMLYTMLDGSCVLWVNPSPTAEVYLLSDEIDPDNFVSAWSGQ